MEAKLKIHPDTAKSGNTDQDFSFWEAETWEKHLTSEEEALRSFDEWEEKRSKKSAIERRMTGNQLERKYGKQEAINIILNEVNNGNPPIVGIRNGQCQLELKFYETK